MLNHPKKHSCRAKSEQTVHKYIEYFYNMKNFIPINVVVGDRTYRIKIEAENEELIRTISKKLNEQLNSFKSLYAGKDMQDYIAMVLLWFVSENHQKSEKINTEVILDKLTNMEHEIDKCLED